MDLELDENALKVLKNVFEWSDIDGDGRISREDLKLSGGLQTMQEAEVIFKAIKTSAGSNPKDMYITYDEFSKGIMDFPFLLEQFKNEFIPKPSEIEINEEDEYFLETSTNQRDSQMNFIISGLRDAVVFYSKAYNIQGSHDISSNREDLLEALRQSLEKLRSKYKHKEDPMLLSINAGVEMYLIVRDLTRFHEEVVSELKNELQEKDTILQELVIKCDDLSDENFNLMHELSNIEIRAIKTTAAHSEALQEKQSLQQKLEKAENNEKNFQEQFSHIQSVINVKERAIFQLEKELRQLNSFKTIKEITGTTGRTTEDMKIRRLRLSSLRQSTPVKELPSSRINFLSPRDTLVSPRSDFKYQLVSNKLKKKDEIQKMHEDELADLKILVDMYMRENDKLKEENRRLLERIANQKVIESVHRRLSSRESIPIPSLYDEIGQSRGGSIEYFMPVALHTEKQRHFADKSIQVIPSMQNIAIQTKERSLEGNMPRGCLGRLFGN
ncbi:hypothetical protein SteCoe_4382 [Stentor coeruleus]|uniref:EF-hand domain-containing protein n=1 Tax=Stentor coeruleus TaxID=5963 RepID=A0A1R2CUS9_9CILI|nr:hypothetical protein SteCoe_4382 [Stentor coeruleus]